MMPIPNTENNYLVLANKDALDIVRAVEREKLRKMLIAAVAKNTRAWQAIIDFLKKRWPVYQSAYYKN